jgi:hypothetical protein
MSPFLALENSRLIHFELSFQTENGREFYKGLDVYNGVTCWWLLDYKSEVTLISPSSLELLLPPA